MGTNLQAGRERWRGWWTRRSRVGRASLWLLAVVFVALLAEAVGLTDGLSKVVMMFAGTALVPLLGVLLYRWFVHRVLWKVRNRLILTYLLMGLAPVVLVATLAGIAGYLLAGQYATDTGLSLLDQATNELRDRAYAVALFGEPDAARTGGGAAVGRGMGEGEREESRIAASELRGGVWVPVETPKGEKVTVAGALATGVRPAWLRPGFQGIVSVQGKLYLCAEEMALRAKSPVVVLASRPLTGDELGLMAKGFGRITLTQGYSRAAVGTGDENVGPDGMQKERLHDFDAVKGGELGPKRRFFDAPVVFSTPITVTAWGTGERVSSLMMVMSRPTQLYQHLFASAVQTGAIVRAVLIGAALFFAVLELMALLMAASLSRTITRSVAELYKGTREIDAGHLEHRIRVRRKDQLAALANSFNGMASSVSELLVQQREKERLLNDLAIAREVQATLFPASPASLPGFEVHGMCLPARTVGGDYFDFIFRTGAEGGLTLALGDISGKGIAAALLMSSLHSADRAFNVGFGGEDGVAPSPAELLKLLNGHLFRSTQSARYATLFLAFYDAGTRRLTYSNGGHLPPLVIARDGTVRRLDCGGSVVGLLEGLEYEEATVQLAAGDLLVAFTDGLTEPERAGEDFGEERLLEFVRAHREEPLTVLAKSALETVKAWIGELEQPDDMTILLARQL